MNEGEEMQRIDISKVVFLSLITVTVVGAAFMAGLYSGVRENLVYEFVRNVKVTLEEAVTTAVNEIPTLTGTPVWHLQPARHDGDGVTINETMDDSNVLLSGFFDNGNAIRLIRRDGSIVAHWPVSFLNLFPEYEGVYGRPATDWNVDTHGALILPDGSVVFNFEYNGLVKLDRCGRLVWTLEKPTHHSVEVAEDGGFWVPSTRQITADDVPQYPPFTTPYFEDSIMKVSEEGEVLLETGVVGIFYANGLEAILTATGESIPANWDWDREVVHLNKIAELKRSMSADFPAFAAGDLLLSIRELNMLVVVDPLTEQVKWWKIGPWIRQHDPEFKEGGTISVFNNNIYKSAFGIDNPYDTSNPWIPRVSNIMEIDPVTEVHHVVYGGKKDMEFLSIIRGDHELTPRGGLLITEFEAGRVFETASDGRVIWEFINRYDDEHVAEIQGARLYPSEYFEVSDWSCKEAGR